MGRVAAQVQLLKVDAVPNAVRSRHTLVCLAWLSVFVVSCGACAFLVAHAIRQYLASEVTTTIRYVTESQSVMPTLTLCNLNPFTSDFALSLLSAANLSQSDANADAAQPVHYWRQFMLIQSYLNATRGYTLTDEEKLRLSANFQYVFFNFQDSNNAQFDPSTMIAQFFHPRYFNCFTFNSRRHVASLEQAYDAGSLINIVFIVHVGGATDRVAQMQPANIKGFYLFVQNASDYALGLDRSPILLTPALTTKIYPARFFYKQQPAPYSACGVLEEDNALVVELADRSLFDSVIEQLDNSSSTYTKSACVSLYAQKMTVERCGCNSQRIGFKWSDASECNAEAELGCAARVWRLGGGQELNTGEVCPLEYSQSVVRTAYSSLLKGHSNTYLTMGTLPKFSSRNRSYISAYLRENTIRAAVVFATGLSYTELSEEVKMSGEQLLAVIGGHLHLFLGMSLLSFVEIGQLLVNILFVFCHRNDEYDDTESNHAGWIVESVRRLKMDALPNMFHTTSRIVSLVWLALLVASGSMCVYLIVGSIGEYNEHLVTTTLSYVTKESASSADEEEKMTTPIVTFCNLSPLTSQYALQLLNEVNMTDVPTSDQVPYFYAYLEPFYVVDIQRYFKKTRGSYLSQEELAKLSDLDQMVISCTVNDNNERCRFEFYSNADYVNCYRVRIGGEDKQTQFKLHLVLYAGIPPEILLDQNIGFLVFVDKPFDMPTQSPSLSVTPGLAAHIALRRTAYHAYPWPYSECTVLDDNSLVVDLTDRSLFDKVVNTYARYSRRACLLVCSQVVTVEHCGCNSLYIDYQEAGFDECDYALECVYEATQVNSTWDFFKDVCWPRCPLECSQTRIDWTSSYYQYPLDYFAPYASKFNFSRNIPNGSDMAQYVYDNVVELTVTYDAGSFYPSYEEEPKMNGEELLGVIGGHLHLFLGMSLMSFVEIVELLVYAIGHVLMIGKSRRTRKDGVGQCQAENDAENGTEKVE